MYYTDSDIFGFAYMKSMETFVRDLDPSLQKHVSDFSDRLSCGARILKREAYNYIHGAPEDSSSEKKSVIKTAEWGQLDFDKLVQQVKAEPDVVFKHGEMLSLRGDVTDVGLLVQPLTPQTPEAATEQTSLNSQSTAELIAANTADIQELNTMKQARVILNETEVAVEETIIAERMRKRLCALVNRGPRTEFQVAPQQPAQSQLSPQMQAQMQAQKQQALQAAQMQQMQQQLIQQQQIQMMGGGVAQQQSMLAPQQQMMGAGGNPQQGMLATQQQILLHQQQMQMMQQQQK